MTTHKGFLSTFNRTTQEDPVKTFAFTIEVDGFVRAGMASVKGLTMKTDAVPYREGGDAATEKQSPGLTKQSPLQISRGQIVAPGYGDDFGIWYQQVFDVSKKRSGTAKNFRKDIDIVQLDGEGNEVARWHVTNAWPSEYTPFGDLDGSESKNAFESLTLQHEGCKRIK